MAEERLDIVVALKDFSSRGFRTVAKGIRDFGRDATRIFRGVKDAVFSIQGGLLALAGGFTAVKFVERAGEVEGVKASFDDLNKALGETSPRVLAALRRGVRDTVSDLDLMKNANSALLLGVGKSAEDFEFLADAARRLGKAVGRDATDSLEQLIEGLGKRSAPRLDNLGLLVKEEQAYKDLAAALGKTVDGLTDAERARAFSEAAFESIRVKLKSLGNDTETAGEALGQLKASIANVVDELALALGPTIKDVLGGLAGYVRSNKPEILEFFADIIEATAGLSESLRTITDAIGTPFELVRQYELGKAAEQVEDLTERLKKLQRLARGETHFSDLFSGDNVANAKNRIAGVSQELEKARARVRSLGEEYVKSLGDGSIAERAIKAARDAAESIRASARAAANEFLFQGPEITPQQLEGLRALEALRDHGADHIATLLLEKGIRLEEIKAVSEVAEEEKALNQERIIGRNISEEAAYQRLQAYRAEQEALEGLKAELRALGAESTRWGVATAQAVHEVTGALASESTEAFASFVEGTKKGKEAFRDFTRAVIRDLLRIILYQLILKALQTGAGAIGSFFSSSPATAGPAVSPNYINNDLPYNFSSFPRARGGVVPGHLEPVGGGGSLASRPGLYKLAEGGRPEAVVQLGDNRTLPVELIGDSNRTSPRVVVEQTIIFNHSFQSPSDERAMLDRNKEMITAIVAERTRQSLSYLEEFQR